MRRFSLARCSLLLVLLIAAAGATGGGLWYRFGLASRTAEAVTIEPLPRLGYTEPFDRANRKPSEINRDFFEEQTTIAEIAQRLDQFQPDIAPTNLLAPELAAEFVRREQGRVAKTPQGMLKLIDAEPGDALAVSTSGSTIAMAKGERCFLFDVTFLETAPDRLQIARRSDPAEINLAGRVGQQLLLDFDGRHVLYLGAGGVVHAANAATGTSAPIDADRLSDCVLLGGGSRGGWMVGGTKRGEVMLFDLRGTIIKSEEVPRANRDYPPGLKSIACDANGQIVLAAYDNDELRWFRRQQDRLTVDGGLIEFPGKLQSVAASERHFAVGGEYFYFGCRIPEAGASIDTRRSVTHFTVHPQTQVGLSDREVSPFMSVWGEIAQVRSDRNASWLSAMDMATGHIARPFYAEIPATASLRTLSAGGSLLAVVRGDVLVAARPAGIDATPPASFCSMLHEMLDDDRYDEIEQCTRYLGEPQRRVTSMQSDWVNCVLETLLPEDGDYRVREQRLIDWLEQEPNSLTAWLALSDHYYAVAFAARGEGWGEDVEEFGWEMVERDAPKADIIVRALLAASYEDPAVFDMAASLSGLAGWSRLEKQHLGERAVELFPRYLGLHNTIALYQLRRWGGDRMDALRHVERIVAVADEHQQDAYYAILAAELLRYHAPDLGVEPLPVDMERVLRGLELPRPEGQFAATALLRMARNAATSGQVDLTGFCLDQFLREGPFLPAILDITTFRHLCEWARTGQALLADQRKKIAAENAAAASELSAEATLEEGEASIEDAPAAATSDAGLAE